MVPAASCPVCSLPYRAELEELLSRGMSFAAVALRLGDRQPPVPGRDELAAHASQGHLLPAGERRQLVAQPPAISGVPIPPAAQLDPAAVLSDAIRAVHARATAGDIRHVATLAPLLKAWAEYRGVAAGREQSRQQLEAAGAAIRLLMDAAHEMCMSLRPLVGISECHRLWGDYRAAASAAARVLSEGGAPSIC